MIPFSREPLSAPGKHIAQLQTMANETKAAFPFPIGPTGCQQLNFTFRPSPYTKEKEFFRVLFVLPTITGILGNLAVLLVVCLDRKVRTRPFLFLISMCVCDLLVALIHGPENFRKLEMLPGMTRGLVKFFCFGLKYVETMALIVIVLNMTAVSIERYMVLRFPAQARAIWKRFHCNLMVATIWVLGLIFATAEVTIFEFECYELQDTKGERSIASICSIQEDSPAHLIKPIIRFFLLFLLPLFVMIYCYGHVIFRLWDFGRPKIQTESFGVYQPTVENRVRRPSILELKSENSISSILNQAGVEQNGTEEPAFTAQTLPTDAQNLLQGRLCQSRKRVVRMLVTVLLLFVVCWGPMLIFELYVGIRVFNGDHFGNSTSVKFGFAVTSLLLWHSTLNPLLFIVFTAEIRRFIFCAGRLQNAKRRESAVPLKHWKGDRKGSGDSGIGEVSDDEEF